MADHPEWPKLVMTPFGFAVARDEAHRSRILKTTLIAVALIQGGLIVGVLMLGLALIGAISK